MKIVFVSNYINHHQIPFCRAMKNAVGPEGEFVFIQTEKMEDERVALGWNADSAPDFVFCSYTDDAAHEKALDLIMHADAALIGWVTDMSLVMPRLQAGLLTIRISERLYKKSKLLAINPRGLIAKYKEHTAFRKGPAYLLCAGAYTASDYGIFNAYPGKMFKWGYFPEKKDYGGGFLPDMKSAPGEEVRILWAGRFIDWKHAENALYVAGKLSEEKIPFRMDIIGTGELEEELKQIATEKRLMNSVSFLGSMPPEKVREYMEKADIFISTSDRNEGWGAVINEAMNSACCVVVPAEAGAVPYMVKNGNNGFVFRSDDTDELVADVIQAARYPEIRRTYGMNAYDTICYTWNAEEAASRLFKLIDLLMNAWWIEEGECGKPSKSVPDPINVPWTDGPCSVETVRDESVVTDNALKQYKTVSA